VLYHWYELGHAAVKPARMIADACRMFFDSPFNLLSHTPFGRHTVAACEVFERATRRYGKPAFGIKTTPFGEDDVAVHEHIVWAAPFCRMVKFERDIPDEVAAGQPNMLLVAPMSGHFATLLRGTVETLLPTHNVYLTDWQDARDIPMAAGAFDLDDYVRYIQDMIRYFDGDVHVFAVCQPSVPVLAAIALMEEDAEAAVPRSLVLAGGPVDTRVSPTKVNELAERKGTNWFRHNVTTTVPWPNLGFGRPVYPGFLQLTGFMTMNLDRHLKAHKDLFLNLVRGDGDSADKHREFYDEYLAVMDLTAEFYIQTIDTVFVRHALPKGEMMVAGRRVNPAAIRRVALMTIEGEKDDITGLGQCRAAIRLCRSLPAEMTYHYEAPGVGHYGIFNGTKFRSQIAPRIEQFVLTHDARAARVATMPAVAREVTRYVGGVAAAEPEHAAFTFAPETAAPARTSAEASPAYAELPGLRLWSMTQQLMLDGLARLAGAETRHH
jgi:poly(3-hydroxybutyrate) depolymerase